MTSTRPLTIVSSDGHAYAEMEDYRPYLDPSMHEDYDAFLKVWADRGTHTFDPPALRAKVDPEDADEFEAVLHTSGRIRSYSNPHLRLKEIAREGVTAEVLFPDFGLPFELDSPVAYIEDGHPSMDQAHREASYRAFNRWLIDFVAAEPKRFAGLGIVSWHDVEDTVKQIHEIAERGLKGICLPAFQTSRPVFHPDFEPIWDAIEEHGLIVNSHTGISFTSDTPIYYPGAPHPGCQVRLFGPELMFRCHYLLYHLVWGGVMARHPGIKFVITESGSGWVPAALAEMDHSYVRGYNRTDFKDIMPLKPSEYFERQCFIGSSIFSRAEIEGRHTIGLHKMMLGMDLPHHEGTLIRTTQDYLRATVGAAGVPEDEARLILGETCASVFGFDLDELAAPADEIGVMPADVLTPPEEELFARGDVHKPAVLRI